MEPSRPRRNGAVETGRLETRAQAYADSLAERPAGGGVRTVSAGQAATEFDIKALTKTTLTLTRCWFLLNMLTKLPEDDLTAALTGTELYVAAKINEVTGEVAIDVNADAGAVFDLTVPTDSRFYRKPLYKLKRPNADADWAVAWDYRRLPVIPTGI